MRFRFLIFALLVPTFGIATSQGQDSIDKEKKALQGSWVVVSAEVLGMPLTSAKGQKFTFAGEKFTLDTKDKKRKGEGVFKLDPSRKPKQIDLDDSKKKTSMKGIYEIKGDEMRLCYGEKRPGEFKSGGGLLFLLKRAKP